ncbi:MAG: hypothetical protein KatS3mg053_1835 [Candidatus Roseilinea sp.]|nr:MAG: hypothetical protein KatS3mg053_1835 [Candidatus Roseilinea sp.]
MNIDEATQKAIVEELKRFGADLNLSDAQKAQAKKALESFGEKASEYVNSGNKPTKEELAAWRAGFRKTLEGFLTPEQLAKWDAEIVKAKTFLGQKL